MAFSFHHTIQLLFSQQPIRFAFLELKCAIDSAQSLGPIISENCRQEKQWNETKDVIWFHPCVHFLVDSKTKTKKFVDAFLLSENVIKSNCKIPKTEGVFANYNSILEFHKNIAKVSVVLYWGAKKERSYIVYEQFKSFDCVIFWKRSIFDWR